MSVAIDAYRGAIAEPPRNITAHPLLERIYERHDSIIGKWTEGRTLKVACGIHVHSEADVGVDILEQNCQDANGRTAVADARFLPFGDSTFDTVIGRRFLHHVPPSDQPVILDELRRVLAPDGCLIILEGTPGLYRRLTKSIGFTLGILGDDEDAYGHLSREELIELARSAQFDIEIEQRLGSVLMPLAISKSDYPGSVVRAVEWTQWVRWWTLLKLKPTG